MAPYAQVPREDGTRVALGAAYSIVLFVCEDLRFFIPVCACLLQTGGCVRIQGVGQNDGFG